MQIDFQLVFHLPAVHACDGNIKTLIKCLCRCIWRYSCKNQFSDKTAQGEVYKDGKMQIAVF